MAVYYCAMHALIKVAFLIYCLRSSSNRRFRLWVGVGFGLNIGLLINLMMIGFQCLPVSAALTIQGRLTGQCVNQHVSLVAPAVSVRTPYTYFYPVYLPFDRTSSSTSTSSSCLFPSSPSSKCLYARRSPSSQSSHLAAPP